jgi:hypothetical protein
VPDGSLGIRSLFNLPVTTMLRREAPIPRIGGTCSLLRANGLQAVADEYLHMLQEWEGVGHGRRVKARRWQRARGPVAAGCTAAVGSTRSRWTGGIT